MDVAIVLVSIILLLCVILTYLISREKFDYWRTKNVVYAKPLPFIGNYGSYIFLKEYPGHVVQKLCRKFPKEPYFGAYYGTNPVLIVKDPEILKHVFTKDFYYFNGREVSDYAHKEVITQSMFFSNGDKWKITRQALTRLFSSAKLKNMFYLIEKSANDFEDMLDNETITSDVLEARNIMGRYTMDTICSCAFGVEARTMGQDKTKNRFKCMAAEICNSSNYRGFKLMFRSVWPELFYKLGLECFPSSVTKFFGQMVTTVFEGRQYKPSLRNDFMDLMINLKNDASISGASMRNSKTGDYKKVEFEIDDDFPVTHSILFFAAGFETAAIMLSFTLYELAKNQGAQTRAMEEVDAYLLQRENKLNYDCVTELPYLEACVYEALRLYPIIGNLTREVVEDYTFPDGLRVEKGVRVHIPVYDIHHNPENFPDPEEYRPERFLPEQMKGVKPYTYFPFGEGPRMCLGKRFAKMQTLPALVTVLKKYRMELADGMPRTVPLESRSLLIKPRAIGLHVKVTARDDWRSRVYAR